MTLAHVLGALTSLDALMSTRTSQGAIAWIVSLNTLPVVSVPAYWVLGRTKFQGYVTIRRQLHLEFARKAEEVLATLEPWIRAPDAGDDGLVGSRLAEMPYLAGNRVDLLVDGEATFASILAGIEEARAFVLVQFYIVRDDGIGGELRDALIAKCREGVPVWFLYDEIGSKDLPAALELQLSFLEERARPGGRRGTRGAGPWSAPGRPRARGGRSTRPRRRPSRRASRAGPAPGTCSCPPSGGRRSSRPGRTRNAGRRVGWPCRSLDRPRRRPTWRARGGGRGCRGGFACGLRDRARRHEGRAAGRDRIRSRTGGSPAPAPGSRGRGPRG